MVFRLEIMRETGDNMNLTEANVGESCIVKDIATDDEELKAFLFRLGCYSGEAITVISRKKSGYTVAIKDGRYNIDSNIAEAIRDLTTAKNSGDVTIFYESGVSS